jgi:hypothetical protein
MEEEEEEAKRPIYITPHYARHTYNSLIFSSSPQSSHICYIIIILYYI